MRVNPFPSTYAEEKQKTSTKGLKQKTAVYTTGLLANQLSTMFFIIIKKSEVLGTINYLLVLIIINYSIIYLIIIIQISLNVSSAMPVDVSKPNNKIIVKGKSIN
ncbi:hypothetical protein ACJX0J_036961 [Zea mays]